MKRRIYCFVLALLFGAGPAQLDAPPPQGASEAEEIAHIIGFVHDDEQQHKFNEPMIPPNVRKLMYHVHGRKPAHQGKIGHKKKRKK